MHVPPPGTGWRALPPCAPASQAGEPRGEGGARASVPSRLPRPLPAAGASPALPGSRSHAAPAQPGSSSMLVSAQAWGAASSPCAAAPRCLAPPRPARLGPWPPGSVQVAPLLSAWCEPGLACQPTASAWEQRSRAGGHAGAEPEAQDTDHPPGPLPRSQLRGGQPSPWCLKASLPPAVPTPLRPGLALAALPGTQPCRRVQGAGLCKVQPAPGPGTGACGWSQPLPAPACRQHPPALPERCRESRGAWPCPGAAPALLGAGHALQRAGPTGCPTSGTAGLGWAALPGPPTTPRAASRACPPPGGAGPVALLPPAAPVPGLPSRGSSLSVVTRPGARAPGPHRALLSVCRAGDEHACSRREDPERAEGQHGGPHVSGPETGGLQGRQWGAPGGARDHCGGVH